MRLFAVAAFIGALTLPAQTVKVCSPPPLYEFCEIEIEMSAAEAAEHSNPYMSVELRAEFRSPKGGRTKVMPGFWDGGRNFKIRFSPIDPGRWDFRIVSNLPSLSGKTGSFETGPARSPGFIQVHNLRYWRVNTRETTHYWMGDTCYSFSTIPWETFSKLVDIRSEQKFNHMRGFVLGNSDNAAKVLADPEKPLIAHFQEVDQRVDYLNQKGLIYDVILGSGANQLAELLPDRHTRERYIRYVVARYSAMNITWQGVERFEEYEDSRKFLKEINRYIDKWDPYKHPRSTAAALTSSSLLEDRWMNYVVQRSSNPALATVEYEIHAVPFVNIEVGVESSGGGDQSKFVDSDTMRSRIWNAAVRGQYVTFANAGTWGAEGSTVDLKYADSEGARAMTHLYNYFAQTRYADLQPYYRVEGGSAIGLTFFRFRAETPTGVEYSVYLDKPGPVELRVPKHGYSISWFNPIDGTWIDEKKEFKGERFNTPGPPDPSHDWVLYLRREGRKEAMNNSFLLAWRKIKPKKIEAGIADVPYEIQFPDTDVLTAGETFEFNATVKKTGRVTKKMQWLWIAEVAGAGIGAQVLGTTQFGSFTIPSTLTKRYPATLGVRLVGVDGLGRVFETFKPYRLEGPEQ